MNATTIQMNSVARDLRTLIARAEKLLAAGSGGNLSGITPEQTKQIKAIVEIVSEKTGVPNREIFSRDRHEPQARARQICMVLARSELKLSYHLTGKIFHRDHGTVDAAEKAIEDLVQTNCSFARTVAGITAEVRSKLQPV
jgi:chromosomal replication initiation ATPase DnaA